MKYLSCTLSIVFFVFLISCSSEEPKRVENNSTQELSSTGTAAQELDADNSAATTQSVHLYGINTMKFVVREKSDAIQTAETVDVEGTTYYIVEGINTKAGQEMELTLTTISDLNAATMSHNWLLLKQKADPSAFAMASLQAKENDYVATEKMHMVIVETGLIAPGHSKTITFTTPRQPGDYEYICTFSGHFAAGMRGTLHVK